MRALLTLVTLVYSIASSAQYSYDYRVNYEQLHLPPEQLVPEFNLNQFDAVDKWSKGFSLQSDYFVNEAVHMGAAIGYTQHKVSDRFQPQDHSIKRSFVNLRAELGVRHRVAHVIELGINAEGGIALGIENGVSPPLLSGFNVNVPMAGVSVPLGITLTSNADWKSQLMIAFIAQYHFGSYHTQGSKDGYRQLGFRATLAFEHFYRQRTRGLTR